MRHTNNGACPKCRQIIETYPGFHAELAAWFYKLQAASPEVHCSAAGRGRDLQELFFKDGSSLAHFGESGHNVNAALDLFRIVNGKGAWNSAWYHEVVAPAIEPWIEWYGAPGSKFFEEGHVEVRDWKKLSLKLVE